MIKLIVHLADLHIRTFQLHDLYRSQFTIFLEEIRKKTEHLTHDEIRFVIAGDVSHQKINVSNEQMLLTSWFFNQLTDIGKVIIIPGNHDFLENNTERVDSITPIIEMIQNPNIKYYKESGVYLDDNINWVVYSLYSHNQRPIFNQVENERYIGIFHGAIQGFSTDLGYDFDDGYDTLNFLGLELVLCGDVHKRAIINFHNTPIIQCGSFLQQNFGETVKHHGYGLYDVENKKYEFFDLPNEQSFMHFLITDINDLDNGKEKLINLG